MHVYRGACFTHWLPHKHGWQPTTTINHVRLRLLIPSLCKQVRPYYNPSLGGWLRDLTRVSYMYIRAPTEDPVVTGLAKHLSMVRTSWPCARALLPTHRPFCPSRSIKYAYSFPPSTPAPPNPCTNNRCYARSGRGAVSSTWRTAGELYSPTWWPNTTSSTYLMHPSTWNCRHATPTNSSDR